MCAKSTSLRAALTTSISAPSLAGPAGRVTIRSSRMPPSSVEQRRVALAAGREARRCRRAPAPRARRAVVAWSAPSSSAWPMCETSNRPACARVAQMLGEDAVGVLHRHLVAGERHHAGAERARARRRAACASGARRKPDRRSSGRTPRSPTGLAPRAGMARVQAPSVAGPERFQRQGLLPSRLTPSVSRRVGRCFPECHPPAVLLPESFRGGCSFGAPPFRLRKRTESLPQVSIGRGAMIRPAEAESNAHSFARDA